jgi:predicted ATP-dependent protease
MKPLPLERLRRRCDPERLPFATTAELEAGPQTLGQGRALEAIELGIGMRREGYNLFAMGPEGLGRHTLVRTRLETQAAALPTPSDWCYVYNFQAPHRPRALRLPPGRAGTLKADMARLVEDLSAAIAAAFESDEYRNRHQSIEAELAERQERAVSEMSERAKGDKILLVRTPSGFAFGPLGKDGVMGPEEFSRLPPAEQKRYEELVAALQKELSDLLHQMPVWRREALRKMRSLDREVTRGAVASLIDELKAEYAGLPQVQAHLAEVQEDTLENAAMLRQAKEIELPGLEAPFRRYAVNVIIEHSASRGAPVVHEDNPTHDALVGRIEHLSQMGALVTDFTLIKGGALHRANGGYLVLDALKVLTQPYAWEALKRALRAREIHTRTRRQGGAGRRAAALLPPA